MDSRLISTRDSTAREYSYTDVLLEGLASDGGLYVPREYPTFDAGELSKLQGAPYSAIALAVKKKLVGDAIPEAQIATLIQEAYMSDVFAIEGGQVVPVRAIGKELYLCNLSLGPTASFKDMAMQVLGREMAFELKRQGKKLTILGATSGDTGSAAEAAFQGLTHIELFMLSPEVGMSAFQKAQMGALSGGTIHNISVRGRFDDCQDLVKAVKSSPEFAHLGAVNSINWGRISSQVPYYVSAYLQTVHQVGDMVDFCIPSGNFGNAFSCYVAKRMGLPVRRIIVATNENNVLDTLIKTGVYQMSSAEITSSPSMDISKASNYERLAFELLARDAKQMTEYMGEFARTGRVAFSDYGLPADAVVQAGFISGSSTHANRLDTIRRVYKESAIIVDPHTADGVFVAEQNAKRDIPCICMETALPVKFETTIQEALGFVPERPSRFVGLEDTLSSNAFVTIDADAEQLKNILRN